MLELIREKYRGTLMLCGGFEYDTAEAWLRKGKADAIAFGRKFLANPDLPERFRLRAPLNTDDPTTYYGGGATSGNNHPRKGWGCSSPVRRLAPTRVSRSSPGFSAPVPFLDRSA
jgi:2,4-dienoyl-CoA reductase-like NADH-dependent reductase (Old Yellow Enzyme family)